MHSLNCIGFPSFSFQKCGDNVNFFFVCFLILFVFSSNFKILAAPILLPIDVHKSASRNMKCLLGEIVKIFLKIKD